MKYYTKEWCYSYMSDDKIEEVHQSYLTYLEMIYNDLPFTLKCFVMNVQLHDGIIKFLSLETERNQFILNGVFGDLESGYYELKLEYQLFNDLNLETKKLFNNKYISILSDEIERLSNNLNVHRILFDNEEEIEITFSKISMSMMDIDPSEYKKQLCYVQVR